MLLAIAPLFAVLGGSLMLELSIPVLRALIESPGAIDPKAAMAFFMIGAVHCALMVMALKVAGTMVAGWNVFGLAGSDEAEGDARAAAAAAAPCRRRTRPTAARAEPVRTAAAAPSREIRLAPAAPAAANDHRLFGRPHAPRDPHRRRRWRAAATPPTPRFRARAGSAAASAPHPPAPRRSSDDPRSCSSQHCSTAAILGAAPAAAEDPRLVERLYDPDEVVTVHGRTNVQATIRFGEDEHIENVAIGDSMKWQVTPNKRANLLFVKPLSERAATNMTVVTDRHTYLFDLVASPTNRNLLYVLSFTYPEEPEDVQQASAARPAEAPTAIEVAAATDPYAVVDPAELNYAWRRKAIRGCCRRGSTTTATPPSSPGRWEPRCPRSWSRTSRVPKARSISRSAATRSWSTACRARSCCGRARPAPA